MKVQFINQVNFESKKRFLNQEQMESLKNVLTRMNNETKLHQNDTWFTSTVTKELSYNENKTRLIDGRMFFQKISDNKQMQKNTMFTIGKTELVVDNKSGEIINWNKPFFTSWKKVMKNISDSLKIFVENFDNSNIVKKKKITLEGFTPKGWEIINKLKKNNKR